MLIVYILLVVVCAGLGLWLALVLNALARGDDVDIFKPTRKGGKHGE